MKRHALFVFVLAFAFGLAMAAPTAIAKDLTKHDMVDAAKATICQVSVADAKALFDKGGYIFLDVRTRKEFKMGHIPGAIHLARGLLEFKIAKKVPDKNANIVIYCRSGGRASLSTCTLCKMGYKNVKNMDGGWRAWVKAGYPID
ncbi:MAG: rhodanese-like domain-containing protein [Thermodesulfobacteriota bacterium]|nr:rhodanese-like domain-containing protein [Thermodesulfobacteriota bacterium]